MSVSLILKNKKNTLDKQFDTLQTTLKCINYHELSHLKQVHWTEFSLNELFRQDVWITMDYPDINPIHYVLEAIRQITITCGVQVKKQRVIYLQLDELYSSEEVQLVTHFVKAINLEISPLLIKVIDFKGKFYQYDKVTLQFSKVLNKGLEYRGIYVLVGGAGGIGLKLGAYLQKHYKAQIYVLGRKPYNQLNEQVKIQLQQAKMIYHCYDPDKDEVLLTSLKQIASIQKISGIFHLAVARDDEWWIKQSENSLSTALMQVVQRNNWLVAEELSQYANNLYVFTSIQAYYPNLGATIYSFEAAFKSYLSAQQKSLPCFVTALGVIEGIGLATSADYSQYMANNNLAPLSFSQLMTLFELQIDTNTPFALITGTAKKSDFIARVAINKNKSLDGFVALSLLLQINQSFPMHGCCIATFLAPFQKHLQLLVRELLHIWQKMHFIHLDNDFIFIAKDLKQLEALKNSYEDELKEGDYASRLKLFAAVYEHYNDLLSGNLLPQQVIFPQGNTELVQGFYEHHAVADHANQVLASKLRKYCMSAQRTIKILEVGAGSGASTRAILAALQGQSYVYYFTDISPALVNKAKRYFSEYEHSMEFRIFNMEHMDAQHEFYQEFDCVIATNAIHATSNILNSLNSLSECLVDGGHLLLNELVEKTPFTTAIFGLFDGWWNAKDPHLRQINSPLLSAEQWMSVLQTMQLTEIEYQSSCLNFSSAEQIVIDSTIKRQGKIKKQSNLLIPLSKVSMAPVNKPQVEEQQSPIDTTNNQRWIIEQLAQTLYLDSETIQLDDRLSDLGFDSLSLSDLYQKLKPQYPELGIAELFAVDTVEALVQRFTNEDFEIPDEVNPDLEHYNWEKDIAIVGLSYQLPHTGSDDFISMLQQGKTAFGPIPKSRWAHGSFAYSGSFLNEIDCFDAAFLNCLHVKLLLSIRRNVCCCKMLILLLPMRMLFPLRLTIQLQYLSALVVLIMRG